MNGYFIKSSNVTPSVYYNPNKGLMDMRGKSSPENPIAFYKHLYESLDQFNTTEHISLTTNMAFEYFNTSSSKCLYGYLKKLASLKSQGKGIVVNWYFEEGDEDMKEAGEDLNSFFDYEFNFIEIPEINILGISKENALAAC